MYRQNNSPRGRSTHGNATNVYNEPPGSSSSTHRPPAYRSTFPYRSSGQYPAAHDGNRYHQQAPWFHGPASGPGGVLPQEVLDGAAQYERERQYRRDYNRKYRQKQKEDQKKYSDNATAIQIHETSCSTFRSTLQGTLLGLHGKTLETVRGPGGGNDIVVDNDVEVEEGAILETENVPQPQPGSADDHLLQDYTNIGTPEQIRQALVQLADYKKTGMSPMEVNALLSALCKQEGNGSMSLEQLQTLLSRLQDYVASGLTPTQVLEMVEEIKDLDVREALVRARNKLHSTNPGTCNPHLRAFLLALAAEYKGPGDNAAHSNRLQTSKSKRDARARIEGYIDKFSGAYGDDLAALRPQAKQYMAARMQDRSSADQQTQLAKANQDEITRLKKDLAAKDKLLMQKETEKTELQQENSKLQQEKAGLQCNISDLQHQKSTLEQTVASEQQKSANLEAETNKSKSIHNLMHRHLEKEQQKVATLEKDAESTKNMVSALEKDAGFTKKLLEEEQRNVATTKKSLEDEQHKIATLNDELAAKQHKVALLENEMEEEHRMTATFARKTATLKEILAILRGLSKDEQKKLAAWEKKVAALVKNEAALKGEQKKSEEMVAALTQNEAALKAEVAALKKQLQEQKISSSNKENAPPPSKPKHAMALRPRGAKTDHGQSKAPRSKRRGL